MQKSKVGSKGEIFLAKKLRERLRLSPGTEIDIKIYGNRLIVQRSLTVKDLLKEPSQVEITTEEFHKFRKDLS